MWNDFKQFILRGNTVDLAVGVVIGASFNSVVNALVKDLITPFVGLFYKSNSFASATFHIHKAVFSYGDFVNALVSFLIIAAVIFFFVVKPINKLTEIATRRKGTDDPSTKKCPFCLSEIPKNAKKCKFCTSKLETSST